ncbi:hemicentin-1 [Manduca sexta]|uniref:hemicentin-1 n=1 Tax=Manduca sexta TaxID=7130 RepID=UPI0018906A13|nr:hemicentin-1 [Manduca sexta]
MYRIVLLMAVLTRAIAPQTSDNDNVTQSTEPSMPATSSMTPPPTVFRSIRVTSRPRRPGMRQKGDSPMLNYIFDSYATSNKHFHDKFRPPSFEGDMASEDTIIDADTGSTVIFDCKVTALRDKTVSWLRVYDNENLELLTLDLDTHTADARYRVDLAGENWKLALSDAKVADSGIYCCHVSTHPPMLRRFKLTVHPPAIRMSKEAFLETGETLSLKCAVLNLYPGDTVPEMHWYRGNTTVSLDEVRGGVLIETDHLSLTSHLQVARLRVEDAGNYTCALEAPLRMRTVARVHVLQGSSLAELQSGVKTTTSYFNLLLTSLILAFGTLYGDIR